MHIVTGMHRSGTSFISQAMNALGADFGDPDKLFPADFWNQNGYFEHIEAIDINNKAILGDAAKIDYWMQAPQDRIGRIINSFQSMKWKYLFFPGIQAISQRLYRHGDRIEVLNGQYQNKYLKDPRFCLTINTWGEIATIESIIFIFRHPSLVAGSIKRREGLPLAFGYRYWEYHNRNFLNQVPANTPTFFFNFDNFFSEEYQTNEFSRLLRQFGNEVTEEKLDLLRSQLDIKLATQRVISEKLPLQIESTYQQLLQLHSDSAEKPVFF